jgi:GMP synthase-like glutamine amidotransferase
MATALVLEHIAGEDVGALGPWLRDAGVDLDVCRLHEGESLPPEVTHDALIVMGGPQDAYGTDHGQQAEIALIAAALDRQTPILGVCLGMQLLALAAGGKVARNPHGPERGFGLVRKADAGSEDPVFRTVPFLPDVVHWHGDEVYELPPGAVPLARGEHTEHQAIRVGTKAWGLQFHVEVDEAMLIRWALSDDLDPQFVVPFPPDVDLERTWRPSAESFARIVRGGFAGLTLI